jgi:para-aminobenzoate synthetase component 1
MSIDDIKSFKQQALKWADGFDVCCYLDSNDYEDRFGKYDFLIAAGVQKEIRCFAGDAFGKWKSFYELHQNWMFGFLSYDLKNETESLVSENADVLDFPDLYFFVPKHLIIGKNGGVEVLLGEEGILENIMKIPMSIDTYDASVSIEACMDEQTYTLAVEEMQQHIQRGDIYEANFCQEFFARNVTIDPFLVYLKLKELSPTPFSGYFKHYTKYILSATPERFMCKRGNKLISQPIKGTAKRSIDPITDELNKANLRDNSKEQAENVMIVDLVRNDLSKNAVKGSVQVEELFGVYGFKQVFQMISTVTCELNPEVHFIDAIKDAFPMGSMTGAPKLRAMQLIESVEQSKRGVYSGAMGYVDPNGDFDLNVVIRSILYDSELKYLSFQVGGAITYVAEAAKEYQECLLKASAMMQTLSK